MACLGTGKWGIHRMLEVWCLGADRQPARRAELGARAAAVTLLDAESCSLGPIDGTVNSE